MRAAKWRLGNLLDADVHARWTRSPRTTCDLLAAAGLAAAYLLALGLTQPLATGDATDYVDSVVAHLEGRDLNYWEFGHLLWRPLGTAADHALGFAARVAVGGTLQTQVTWVLTLIATAAGLVALLAAWGWLRELRLGRVAAFVGAATLLVTRCFLDFAQAGTSYIPATATLFVALWLLAVAAGRPELTRGRSIALACSAGLLLAACAGFWMPMLVAAPAVLLSPVLLGGNTPAHRRLAIQSALSATACATVLIAVGAFLHGAHDAAALREWVTASAHGIDAVGGAPRAVLGFGRAFVDVDDIGLQVKRYLLHDPYNTVTSGMLWASVLWKLALVYAFVLGVTWLALGRRRERGRIAFFALGALPVATFAILWQGGDMERYLPLFPLVAFGVGLAVDHSEGRRAPLAGIGTFLAFAAIVNTRALSAATVGARCDAAGSRVEPLAARLRPHDLVATAYSHDDASWYTRDCPFHAGNARRHLEIYAAVVPGTRDAAHWRRSFALRALATWRDRANVWLARRALRPRPDADWEWTEGEDPAVRWADFPAFFSTLELSDSVGGADGFVEVAPSPANVASLTAVAGER